MIEPLSDSMDEDIFPVSRRSVGLRRGERGGQDERGERREHVERTLGVGWGMNQGSDDCRYRKSQDAMRWGSQRRLWCRRQG